MCLYDIRLEYNGHAAQFDFIVMSNKYICIIETKKLSGNIIINQDGDFIRVIKNKHGKEIKREGMYSPVSQNERHLNILREVLVSQGLIKHMPLKSLIVLANPHTIIDKKNCPRDIVNSIYKYDQVINFLKKSQEDKDNDMNVLEANLYNIANYLIANNKPLSTDYISKYGLTHDNFISNETLTNVDSKDISANKKDKEILYKQLKEYCLLKSREENIKAFYIFNNEQMDDMISRYPTTEEDLMKVKGIGQKKVEKYGKDIINIFIS